MAQPLISILHPTARVKPSEGFPRGWKDARNLFLSRADHPERIEYVLAVHGSRWADLGGSDVAINVQGAAFLAVRNSLRDCVVDQLNCAAAASTGKLLIGIMDDLEPPEHWDTKLLKLLPICPGWAGPESPQDLDGEYIIDLTGEPSEHLIYGAMTRKRYERYGHCVDPRFESMFADNWQNFQAKRDEAAGLCKLIDGKHLGFKHNHPIHGRGKMDAVYELQNRPEAYRQGQATFMKLAYGTQVLYVCCPGETFRADWIWPTFSLLMQLHSGSRFMVAPIGGHTSNVYCTRIEMAKRALGCVPEPDFILWLDDDNVLMAEQFNMLYQDLLDHPDLSGVVGWCWCDHDGRPLDDGSPKPWMMSVGRQTAELGCKKLTLEDLERAKRTGKMLITSDDLSPDAFWSGFPCVLLRGSALKELGWRAFKPRLNDDVMYEFTGEDTSFFLRAKELGQKWAVDLNVKVPHMKLRQIEPFGVLTETNRDEYLKEKGLKLVPLEEQADAAD